MKTHPTYRFPAGCLLLVSALLVLQILCSSGAASAEEPRVQDVAVPVPWVVGSPDYSDVLMRSITVYDGSRAAKDQAGQTVYPNAKTAAADFHITDITWSYVNPITSRSYVEHFTNNGIHFGLSVVINRSTTTSEGREMAMRNISGDFASRGFDGMIFSCRNRKSLIDFSTATIINRIAALPRVGGDNTAYVQLDDPGIHNSAVHFANRGCFCDECVVKFAPIPYWRLSQYLRLLGPNGLSRQHIQYQGVEYHPVAAQRRLPSLFGFCSRHRPRIR